MILSIFMQFCLYLDITAGMAQGVVPYPDAVARMLLYVRSHSLAHEIKAIIEKAYEEQDRQIDVPVWRGRQDELCRADRGR